ncbi:unnamed protein product [Rotaria sordida]|uniref:Uncharacterized protein n=1 Tax=Rotaria sordida TaxID=392033 RepID=A0A815L955_9BILA|nr:unnamed protein product [Rotaria sordida]CAF3753243.1 unnamed protein product [Rotaria sordida]
MFFCQLISSSSSSSKFNNQALTIVKSIDDYLCQNYIFTCFFRQRYYQSYVQQQINNCKSFLILYSCLHYDTESIRMCHQPILNQVKLNLADQTPIYCLTSSIYKTLYIQHLSSKALPKMTISWQIFILIFFFTIS